jgi:hypothetical protein
MNIEMRNNSEQLIKVFDTCLKEPAVRVNVALVQPSGFVQGLAGTKHRFRNAAERGETVVEFYAVTDKTKDAVEINSYISNAKLALR